MVKIITCGGSSAKDRPLSFIIIKLKIMIWINKSIKKTLQSVCVLITDLSHIGSIL